MVKQKFSHIYLWIKKWKKNQSTNHALTYATSKDCCDFAFSSSDFRFAGGLFRGTRNTGLTTSPHFLQ